MSTPVFPTPRFTEGQECPHCKKGVLQLRTITKPGVNQGKQFLLCSGHVVGDFASCQFFSYEKPAAA